MVKIKELEGHTLRVLHMACSPNGGMVVLVSAAANETLRFWDVFALPSKTKESRKRSVVADFTSMKFCWTMQLHLLERRREFGDKGNSYCYLFACILSCIRPFLSCLSQNYFSQIQS
jgi:hypothetical protein